ncbi:embryo-specific protein ATS3A [Aristolochia californica]|uniref:embryo-specific protein ATS3A n=1 Tax=Aristolochia californica TaxID=171875 RepID=UPI0035E1443F
MVKALVFLHTFLCLFILLVADSVDLQPHELPSFKVKNTTTLSYSCSYTVSIKTSCSSRSYTRDAISIAFGDAYGNEIYAARIDDPSSRTFERCSTDTFKISGPCSSRICYLYLLRRGSDGWKPESVKISEPHLGTITFKYNLFLPNGVWYGFDLCNNGKNDQGLFSSM